MAKNAASHQTVKRNTGLKHSQVIPAVMARMKFGITGSFGDQSAMQKHVNRRRQTRRIARQ